MITNSTKQNQFSEFDIPEDNWLNILSFLPCDDIQNVLLVSKSHFALQKRDDFDFYTAYGLCDKFEITVANGLSPLDELRKYRKIKKEIGGDLIPLVCRVLGPTAFEKLPVLSKEFILKKIFNANELNIDRWYFHGSELCREENSPSYPIVIGEINKIYFITFNCIGHKGSLKTVVSESRNKIESIGISDCSIERSSFSAYFYTHCKFKEYITTMLKEEISLPAARMFMDNLLDLPVSFKQQFSLYRP